jgi:hypothetical protein
MRRGTGELLGCFLYIFDYNSYHTGIIRLSWDNDRMAEHILLRYDCHNCHKFSVGKGRVPSSGIPLYSACLFFLGGGHKYKIGTQNQARKITI